MTTNKLRSFFEENGFRVHLSKQDKVQCAEVEKWTTGGVDMIIWLNPFTIKEFESYVNDFNVDEEIDLHRNEELYKSNFTIKQSLEDFTEYHNHLKDLVKILRTK